MTLEKLEKELSVIPYGNRTVVVKVYNGLNDFELEVTAVETEDNKVVLLVGEADKVPLDGNHDLIDAISKKIGSIGIIRDVAAVGTGKECPVCCIR